jgi:hypothetical protein
MASRRRAFTLSVLSASALVAAALPASEALASTTAATGITIQVDQSGKCFNVSGASTANGAKVVQYTCTASGTNDHWQLVPAGNNLYQVKGVGSGKCLTVSGASTADKAGLVIYTCNTGYNELWGVDEIWGRPVVRLISANTGKCVNVPGASTANNVQLVQYTCTAKANAANERFYFPPTTSPSPVSRAFSTEEPISVVQAGNNSVHFSWLDSSHQLNMLTDLSFDPEAGTAGQNTNYVGTQDLYGFTGPTSIAKLQDGRVQVAARDAATGDTYVTDEDTVGSGNHTYIDDIGGTSAVNPTVGLSNPSTGSLAAFTIVNGSLWVAPEQVNDLQPAIAAWRNLGGTGLVGTPVTAQTIDGTQVYALNTAGQLQTATFDGAKTLSAWVNLGGTGLTGTPAATVITGYRQFVFSNTTTGTIVYKEQNADHSWPADWKTADGVKAVGNPSAIMQPWGGTATVATRDAAGHLYYAAETAEGSGTISAWQDISDPANYPESQTASDPTLFAFQSGSGQSFGIAFSTAVPNEEGPYYYAFHPNTRYPATSAAAKATSSTAKKPALHKLVTAKTKAKKAKVQTKPFATR